MRAAGSGAGVFANHSAAGVDGGVGGTVTVDGYGLLRTIAQGSDSAGSGVSFALIADSLLGAEGYEIRVTDSGIMVEATAPAGLFHGTQTLLQLLPTPVEAVRGNGTWKIAQGVIRDYPRYAWRGAMLDVSRHFFTVDEVKRFLDQMAAYKLNLLQLHLSDDQGWRIEIVSWPRLAEVGGLTAVGGGAGGYYTQAEYREIVAYAAERFITVVPEIDMPGHTNAALVAYPELNCNGKVPAPYTGIAVGFSSLCTERPIVLQFVRDVIGEARGDDARAFHPRGR